MQVERTQVHVQTAHHVKIIGSSCDVRPLKQAQHYNILVTTIHSSTDIEVAYSYSLKSWWWCVWRASLCVCVCIRASDLYHYNVKACQSFITLAKPCKNLFRVVFGNWHKDHNFYDNNYLFDVQKSNSLIS